MEQKLLELAINSILHGSTQTITEMDSNGNPVYREIKINDLRIPLIEKLAQKLATTQEFKDLLEKVFTPEVIKKMQERMINDLRYNDLPYAVKNRIDDDIKKINVDVKRFKVVAEVVESDEVL